NNGGTPPLAPPTGYALSAVAISGGPVPGQPSGVAFTAFGEPIIDASGRVAFWATYGGSGAKGSVGLYVWNGTALAKVVDNDPASAGAVPSHTPAAYFGGTGAKWKPLEQPLAWNTRDRLLFGSDITDGTNPSFVMRGVYRWRVTDGNMLRVADFEQVGAGLPDVKKNSANFPMFEVSFANPGVTDAGIAQIGMSYLYLTQSGSPFYRIGQGMITSNGTTVTIVADSTLSLNDPGDVPEQGPNGYFTYDSPPTANDLYPVPTLATANAASDAIFQAKYAAGTYGAGRGVYLVRSNQLYRVIDARTNASWPGLPSGAQVNSAKELYRLAIGPVGHMAIDTTLTAGGQTAETVLLWTFDAEGGGIWKTLTGDGAAATALVSGVSDDGWALILAGGHPYLASATGSTRLDANLPAGIPAAELTWANTGGSINNWGRVLVPYAYADGGQGLVLWNGTQLLVVADPKKNVPANLSKATTMPAPERDRPGMSGAMNDWDQVTFRAALTAGGQAIYLGQPQR
ncbi:MAG: hypothetical protein AB1716_13780, partial [Planctomycetota bacterium]